MAKRRKNKKVKKLFKKLKRVGSKAALVSARGWRKVSPMVHAASMIGSIVSGGVSVPELVAVAGADKASQAIINAHRKKRKKKKLPKRTLPFFRSPISTRPFRPPSRRT